MTYQVLARKWRPRKFKEMAGQDHVLKILVNSLDNQRLHHAYLFTGTRGVGKTTVARILAKCLNCEAGVTSEPCGQCGPCREIDEGRFLDLIEVDAASRTKVEDTRELLDNVQYAPTGARYKVYLIDEVHMLSGHSFNALLKTLEEPPEHVKFLLATTNPQKLPVTVLSRCLQFNLKNLSPEQLVSHLRHILQQEGIGFEEPALWRIAQAARGSARDALTLLDQAIAYCDGPVTASETGALLGTIDQAVIHALVEALAAGNAKAVLEVIDKAAEHAPDFAAVLEDLLSYLHRVAIAQAVPEGIDNSHGDRERVLEHAAALPAENVHLYYQIALKGREELPLACDAREGLEMTLLRMLAFTPHGVPQSPSVPLRADSGEEAAAAGATESGEDRLKKKPVETRPPPPADDASFSSVAETEPGGERPEDGVDAGVLPPGQTKKLDSGDWIRIFQRLEISGITRSIAANCAFKPHGEDAVTLVLDESHATLFNAEHGKRIQEALSGYFRKALKVTIEPGAVEVETPAAHRARMERERLLKARETFENDAVVRDIVERFAGTIQQDSIEPLTPEQG